ncbi:alpha/beta fold hydrolase [Mesobacterium pallidum]|uniref:alpha/beta fold hydrolase n=1 Tax=Mesobacterium pallidum TaxID=2872037 RepID=UPI001EE1D87A|nr:alpha/beta hydrolase [Mesobacterium pallidum]
MSFSAQVGIFVLISLGVTFAVALGLIASQRPGPLPESQDGLAFDRLLNRVQGSAEGLERTTYGTPPMPLTVAGRGADKPILVLVHGSGWDGTQFDGLAARLADAAEVRVPTLRGHGPGPERRGDVDYIGQLEDDLAALVSDAGDRDVVFVGHSSGGGLVVRMAGGRHGQRMDAAVLLAPFLKYNAPVTRANSGGWAHPLTRRIIGLSILNAFRIHLLDRLTVIQFAMPRRVLDGPMGGHATTAYSWRLNTSFAPRGDYLSDVAALPPFVLVAGAEDEAFVAEGYEPLLTQATTKGRYQVLPGVGHLDLVDAPQTETLIREVLHGL